MFNKQYIIFYNNKGKSIKLGPGKYSGDYLKKINNGIFYNNIKSIYLNKYLNLFTFSTDNDFSNQNLVLCSSSGADGKINNINYNIKSIIIKPNIIYNNNNIYIYIYIILLILLLIILYIYYKK